VHLLALSEGKNVKVEILGQSQHLTIKVEVWQAISQQKSWMKRQIIYTIQRLQELLKMTCG
jgi:hypothetical protein